MARARTTAEQAASQPVAPALPPKVCGTCAHWRPNHMSQAFGTCQKSFVGHGGMLNTTDHTSCSLHEYLRQ